METQIQIVKRDTIPPLRSVDQGGEVHQIGELRDFSWSSELRGFLPDPPVFSASWVCLKHKEVLQPHTHPVQSMMIVYAGSGDLVGDLCRVVVEGDVIVVPPGQRHGFVGGADGLYALSIQFGEGLYTEAEKPRVIFTDSENSLNTLLAYNGERAARFVKHPIFGAASDGLLVGAASRARFFALLWEYLEGTYKAVATCYASCREPDADKAFAGLLQSWLAGVRPQTEGHGAPERRDVVVESVVSWLAYQMYVVDKAEKIALVCFVLGTAEAALHRFLSEELGEYPESAILRGWHGPSCAEAGAELLRKETAQTYVRLKGTIGQAWDMVGAAADRIVERTVASEA